MSGYLLDTNVVSELTKPSPDERVVLWVSSQATADLFISAITLGELARGIARLPDGRRREGLRHWLSVDLDAMFSGRVLPYDQQAALLWGELMGQYDRGGRPRSTADTQIAAIAIVSELTVATRNVDDFSALNLRVLDPWRVA